MKRILTALGAALIGTPMLAQADAYHGRLGAFLIPSSDIEARSGAFPATCLLYTSPSPRDLSTSRMPSSA